MRVRMAEAGTLSVLGVLRHSDDPEARQAAGDATLAILSSKEVG
jgi:hypothetical protein